MYNRRITEDELIVPALHFIDLHGSTTTSDLIEDLTNHFRPTGEDAEILEGRNDTKFSQKVRNLKSHRDSNGMAVYTDYDDGIYTLTQAGREHLENNRHRAGL